MDSPIPLRQVPQTNIFRKGDVFVLFGELFGRSYANGLVNRARKAGMEIVGITVGRRDENNALRPLNEEELAEAEANLGGRIINLPLMAGFDLDAPPGEPTPTEMLGKLTLKTWTEDKLDWAHIEKCREVGVRRFKDTVAEVMQRLDAMIPDGRNAFSPTPWPAGIPKAKVFLAIASRIYKGRGDRFMSSQVLLDSDLGKLILMNFGESRPTPSATSSKAAPRSAPASRRAAARCDIRRTAITAPRSSSGPLPVANLYQLHPGLCQDAPQAHRRATWAEGVKATV